MPSLGRDRRAGGQVRRAGVIIVIVLAIAFVVVQTSGLVRSTVDPVRAGMDDIIVQSTSAFDDLPSIDLASQAELQQEINALRTENRQLAIWRDTATSMSERIARYEELLNLIDEPVPSGVSARVVTETQGPFAETRLANAGARNGVKPGDIAINTQGVVGRVIRVGNRSSRILLVTDFNSRVPVMGEISGVRAMLAGGSSRQAARLIDKPETDPFIEGENLLTTGEGNAFPRGLRIGRAVQNDGAWVGNLALAEAPLDFVRLLPAPKILRPEDDPVLEAEPEEVAADDEPIDTVTPETVEGEG